MMRLVQCRFQKTGVTASILDAYRLPQLVQGWEWGMLRFLRARVTSETLVSLMLPGCQCIAAALSRYVGRGLDRQSPY